MLFDIIIYLLYGPKAIYVSEDKPSVQCNSYTVKMFSDFIYIWGHNQELSLLIISTDHLRKLEHNALLN